MEALDWLHLPNLEVRSGILGVAEIRDGPSGELIVVELEPGSYRPCVGTDPEGRVPGAIASFCAVHESVLGGWRERRGIAAVRRGGVVGWVSTDIATAGFFDHDVLAELAARDAEVFEQWCAGFFASMSYPHGFGHFGGDGRAPVVYVQSSAGAGHYPVVEILGDDGPVGLEVAFSPAIVDSVDVSRDLQVTRVVEPSPGVLQEI